MRGTGRLVAIVLTMSLGAVIATAAAAASGSEASQPASIVSDLKFRPVVRFANGHCGPAVLTSGRYALVSVSSPSSFDCPTGFVLIDDQTHQRTVIHESGLTELLAFGAPWIFFFEDNRFVLYNIVTKRTRNCDVPRCVPSGEAISYAVGRRWLETFVQQPGSCGDGMHYSCGPVSEAFYNITTGQRRNGSVTNSTTVADLDSGRLFQHVCPPLRVPPGGTLTFYGRFAVATESDRSSVLERCGSKLHMPVGMSAQNGPVSSPIASTRAVVWTVIDPLGEWHGQIAGVLLPSLRSFTTTVPLSFRGFLHALTAFRLYVGDPHGRLWAARMPT
jgi:hypothetical protein